MDDWERWWQAINYDCLGCLQDAQRAGILSDQDVQDVITNQAEVDRMQTVPCVKCQQPAYVSMYEPDVAHCPACGLYSYLDTLTGEWCPLRQGAPLER